MSTPTAVLGEFWTELREKSRVRIEHPDLPTDLQAAAGELVATLWTRSTASAQGALDALRAEVEAERAAAQDAVTSMQGELARTETALEQRTAALLAAQVRIHELEQAQAGGEATRRALEAEIARLQAENAERDRSLAQAGWRKSVCAQRRNGRCWRSSVSGPPAHDSRRSSTPRRAARSRARRATAASYRPCRRSSPMPGTRPVSSRGAWRPCATQALATRVSLGCCDSRWRRRLLRAAQVARVSRPRHPPASRPVWRARRHR
jgi:hypothetical protein